MADTKHEGARYGWSAAGVLSVDNRNHHLVLSSLIAQNRHPGSRVDLGTTNSMVAVIASTTEHGDVVDAEVVDADGRK